MLSTRVGRTYPQEISRARYKELFAAHFNETARDRREGEGGKGQSGETAY